MDCAQFVSQNLHLNICKHPDLYTDIRKAVTDGFLLTHRQWKNAVNRLGYNQGAGCTAVISIIFGRSLVVAWAGDSSAILFMKNGTWIEFVNPHKPSLPVTIFLYLVRTTEN